jgi:hypothetical protein
MDAKAVDEVNGIGGVLRLMQDAVAPQLLGDQADLVEGGSQPAKHLLTAEDPLPEAGRPPRG